MDPFAPLPPGATQAGVQANLDASKAPANTVAYARLQENAITIGYGQSGNANAVRVLNTMPLVADQSYIVQVQFAPINRQPGDLDWNNPASVFAAPVVTNRLLVTGVTTSSTGVDFSWTTSGGSTLAGAYLQVVDTASGAIVGTSVGTASNNHTDVSFAADQYAVMISGIQPINGSTTGNFDSPYTIGPPSNLELIPTASLAITGVNYDGETASATWTPPTLPTGQVIAQSFFEITLLDGTDIVSIAPASSSGGKLNVGDLSSLTAPKLAGRLGYGPFLGAPGTAVDILSHKPSILDITVAATSTAGEITITAALASPGSLPASGVISATLYANNTVVETKTLASATGNIVWTLTPAANTTYNIDAHIAATPTGLSLTGPNGDKIPVPVNAVSSISSAYDGKYLTIDLEYDSAPSAEAYILAITEGSNTTTMHAGPTVPITLSIDLDVSKTWTVTAQPVVMGLVKGLVSTSATVSLPTITAPIIKSMSFDGLALNISWNAAALPYLDGYIVTIGTGANQNVLHIGAETNAIIPLTIADAGGKSVTISGKSPWRNSPASSEIQIITAYLTITESTIASSKINVTWAATGTPAPDVLVSLNSGEIAVFQAVQPVGTGIAIDMPTDTNQPYQLNARVISADSVSTGPATEPVNLSLEAPAIIGANLIDGNLSLEWSSPATAQNKRHAITATPTSGAPATIFVDGSSYSGPVPSAFLTPGTISIQAVGDRTASPTATLSVAAAPELGVGNYDGSRLAIFTGLTSIGTNDTYLLDVLTNGTVVGSTLVTGPQTIPVAVDVSLPVGASVTARLAGVGPNLITPESTLVFVPTTIPVAAKAAYDGTHLHVTWQPAPGPGVDGYYVSIEGTNPAFADTFVAGGDTASFSAAVTLPYPFPAESAITVTSTSNTPHITGITGASIAPTLAGYSYAASVIAAGDPPYLFRHGDYQTLADVTAHDIVLYLPKPFTGTANPTVPASGSPVFQLAPAPTGSSLPYQLTISADIWSTLGADPMRSTVRDAYASFLSAVETEGTFPWAILLLRQMIAEAAPQTFAETLYYRYGLWRDDSLRVADLTPGTRLNLSNALYQTIVSGSNEKNGFLAQGTETLDLTEVIPQGGAVAPPAGSGRALSVDAFMSLIYPGSGNYAGEIVAAGPADFFINNNRQAYYRIFYPATILSSGSNGSTSLTSNITIIGATSWATLETVTSQYATTGTFPTSNDYFATYFRGRSSITPLINVAIMGQEKWVPIGTTVRQLLFSQGLAPLYGGEGGEAIKMTRSSANLFNEATLTPGLTMNPISLGNQDMAGNIPLYWPLDLPVASGDQISLAQN